MTVSQSVTAAVLQLDYTCIKRL